MKNRAFTSSMTPREYAAALLWLPVHLVLLPLLCVRLMENGSLTESQANLLVYGAGALCLSLLCSGFLRRDFDPLCDNLPGCLLEILLSYGLMLGCNLIASTLLNVLENLLGNGSELLNQNNEALLDLAGEDFGSISAVAIFLAPIAEELMFRGGIFGLLRKKSRAWAYAIISGVMLFWIPLTGCICCSISRRGFSSAAAMNAQTPSGAASFSTCWSTWSPSAC